MQEPGTKFLSGKTLENIVPERHCDYIFSDVGAYLNFDIIGLNETWLDTLDKHVLAEVSIQGYMIFSVDKPIPIQERRWIYPVCQELA